MATPSDYQVDVNLRQFRMKVANNSQDIRVVSVVIENQAIKAELYSAALQKNNISTVTFTILIAKLSVFTPPLVYVYTYWDSYCFDCRNSFTIAPNGVTGIKAD